MFPVRPSGMSRPGNRLVSSSYWRTASRGSPDDFHRTSCCHRSPGSPGGGLTWSQGGHLLALHSNTHPRHLLSSPGFYRGSCLQTGSSNLGSRTGSQIYTEKQDEKWHSPMTIWSLHSSLPPFLVLKMSRTSLPSALSHRTP